MSKANYIPESPVAQPVNSPEELNRIALSFAKIGDYISAAEYFKKIVQTDLNNDKAFFNIGLSYQMLGQGVPACEAYKKTISINPYNHGAYLNLGVLYVESGDFEKGLECYVAMLENLGKNFDAFYNLGFCCQNLGKYDDAAAYYLKAIEIKPDDSKALNSIALLFIDQKKIPEAEKYLKHALEIDENDPNTLNNISHLKLALNRPEMAAGYLEKAEKIVAAGMPIHRALIYGNLGVLNYQLGNFEKALQYYNRALEYDPEAVMPHNNKSSILLLKGDFSNGWKEYEWRMQKKDWAFGKISRQLKPGDWIDGKKILVLDEQGFGDAIQFVRYLPMLKNRGAHVTLECRGALMNLFCGFEGADEIIEMNAGNGNTEDYDYVAPLLSLPLFFGTMADTIPCPAAYICPDAEKVKKWSGIFNNTGKKKIGIVWAGNPSHVNDSNRSCRFSEFLPLFDLDGTDFFSLQRGPGLLETAGYEDKFVNLECYGNFDFSDTAAVIAGLDLVITVDTSVAHLVGAMGKQVWVLLPLVLDWRWMLNRSDSPWYPSMRLFRQTIRGVWTDVFKKILNDLSIFEINESAKKRPDSLRLAVRRTKL